jgi:hypothetical protein
MAVLTLTSVEPDTDPDPDPAVTLTVTSPVDIPFKTPVEDIEADAFEVFQVTPLVIGFIEPSVYVPVAIIC